MLVVLPGKDARVDAGEVHEQVGVGLARPAAHIGPHLVARGLALSQLRLPLRRQGSPDIEVSHVRRAERVSRLTLDARELLADHAVDAADRRVHGLGMVGPHVRLVEPVHIPRHVRPVLLLDELVPVFQPRLQVAHVHVGRLRITGQHIHGGEARRIHAALVAVLHVLSSRHHAGAAVLQAGVDGGGAEPVGEQEVVHLQPLLMWEHVLAFVGGVEGAVPVLVGEPEPALHLIGLVPDLPHAGADAEGGLQPAPQRK